jgi:hypothetical protein
VTRGGPAILRTIRRRSAPQPADSGAAAIKTDVVELLNDYRITRAIRKFERGQLTIKTGAIGT